MWKQLFELMRQVLRLTEDTQQNRADLKELQKELRDLSRRTEQEVRALHERLAQEMRELRLIVERLAAEVEHGQEHERHEREKLVLQLENQLLRFERLLPRARGSDDQTTGE